MENIQLSLFGKTCPEPIRATKERTFARSCRKSRMLPRASMLYLDLQTVGLAQEPLWVEDFQSLGERWTRNIGEYPNVVKESSLSQILEADVPEKYFLSATACAGFKGGQGTGQIGWQEECAATLGANMSHNEPTICIATQQGGAEIVNNLCPTITAAAGMSGNNQPCICIAGNTTERHAVCAIDCRNHCANEISGTLQAKPNGGQSLNYQNPVMTFGYQSFGEYKNADVSKTLMASGDITTSDLVATYAISRLTPLECCRLQGFPDWWMDGINGSDSAKYKMWGNGIALPCALYVMEGIAELREGKSNE